MGAGHTWGSIRVRLSEGPKAMSILSDLSASWTPRTPLRESHGLSHGPKTSPILKKYLRISCCGVITAFARDFDVVAFFQNENKRVPPRQRARALVINENKRKKTK